MLFILPKRNCSSGVLINSQGVISVILNNIVPTNEGHVFPLGAEPLWKGYLFQGSKYEVTKVIYLRKLMESM